MRAFNSFAISLLGSPDCEIESIKSLHAAMASGQDRGSRYQVGQRCTSGWDDVMAKVIEFYVLRSLSEKVKWFPRDQRGKVIEFPKEKPALAAKADQIRELDQAGLTAVSWPGCF